MFFLQSAGYIVSGFVAPSLRSNIGQYAGSTAGQDASLLRYPSSNPLLSVAASASATGETPAPATQKGKKTLKELREEGVVSFVEEVEELEEVTVVQCVLETNDFETTLVIDFYAYFDQIG